MNTAALAARRQLTRSTKPLVCYAVEKLPPKKGGEALYAALQGAPARGDATLEEQLVIPPKDARSWKVPAGWMWRIVCIEGPQVCSNGKYSLARSIAMISHSEGFYDFAFISKC